MKQNHNLSNRRRGPSPRHLHSLNDNQDKAYQEIINQVNAEYGDGGVLQFYSLQGIKDYFEIVHIQTQELTSIGFKTAILDL